MPAVAGDIPSVSGVRFWLGRWLVQAPPLAMHRPSYPRMGVHSLRPSLVRRQVPVILVVQVLWRVEVLAHALASQVPRVPPCRCPPAASPLF